MIEAGHPVPDAAGLTGAERALELADQADQDDLVLVLLSGGASANWIAAGTRYHARREASRDAGACCGAAPISAKSIASGSISPASKAAASPAALSRPSS